MTEKETTPLRFLLDVAMNHSSEECLTWPYARNMEGYGRVRVGRKMHLAHRYICTLVNGAPPAQDYHAAHSCGKGRLGCVNPRHVSWKTPRENIKDKITHGTQRRGETNGGAKITEEQVLQIMHLKGIESQRSIAFRFGITQSSVSRIHMGTRWSWLIGDVA